MRAGGVYVAAAFIALQLGEIVLPAFNRPDWWLQFLVILSVLGLPVVLALAWVYDLTSRGIRRTAEAETTPEGGAPIGPLIPRLALLFVTVSVVGAASLWVMKLVSMPSVEAVSPASPATLVARSDNTPIMAVAVLPLEDFSPEDDGGLFASALHEEFINQIIDLTSLRVVSRTTTAGYADSEKTAPTIAKELQVQGIVEGSVQRSADSVRISVRLFHAPSETQLWNDTYVRALKNAWSLQAEVAREIAIAIQGQVDQPTVGVQVASLDPEAHQAYLQGQAAWREGTPEGLEFAAQSFSHAIDIDSSFAAAFAGLAGTQVMRGLEGLTPLGDALMSATDGAERALALDSTSGEARAVMMMIADHVEDLSPEQREVINIVIADSLEHDWAAQYSQIGRRVRHTMIRSEGGDTRIRGGAIARGLSLARELAADGKYDEALVIFRRVAEENPTFAPAWDALERTYVVMGDVEAAVEVRTNRLLNGAEDTEAAQDAIVTLRAGFSEGGEEGYFRWILEDHDARSERGESVSEVEFAAASMNMGHYDEALDALERALTKRERGLISLRTDPIWDPIRDNLRFREITRRVRRRGYPSPSRDASRPGNN